MKITFPKIIYGVSYIWFILSLALLFYVTFGALLYLFEEIFQTNFEVLERLQESNGEMVYLNIPLIKFGIGFPAGSFVVVFMVLFFGFYSFYFYLMKNFFQIFISDISFTQINIRRSIQFIWINGIPILFWAIFVVYYLIVGENKNIFDEEFFIILIHILVIFLVYLYRDVLKKGIQLQQENDLTI